MIPKVIHYCWFGKGKKPDLIQKCIQSWKENLPDYRIVEWNESNFEIRINKYAKEAYDAKKWAFVTDFVRLYVLYHYGGIYLDADVEVIKPLDKFLQHSAFSGFEDDSWIPTGIIGAQKGNLWIKEQLDYYNEKSFVQEDGSFDTTTNCVTITDMSIEKHGLLANGKKQVLKYDMHIYPRDWFCPKIDDEKRIYTTKNTYTIHHFYGSWLPVNMKKRVKNLIIKLFGYQNFGKIRDFGDGVIEKVSIGNGK